MRIEEKFKQLGKEKKKAFIAYYTFGFPEISYTSDICLALQDAGVDIIELGFPFSDPLADGSIIQKASSIALQQKINLNSYLKILKDIQRDIKIPVVFMSYYNPVFKYGIDSFFSKLAERGASGSIIVDLPLEESRQYLACSKKFNINPVFFITPATSPERAKRVAAAAKGFIYYISITGTTGPRSLNFKDIASQIKEIKRITATPVCVGFGIHNRRQVKAISSFSDGVIVGSEIIKFIGQNYKRKNFLKSLKRRVEDLGASSN